MSTPANPLAQQQVGQGAPQGPSAPMNDIVGPMMQQSQQAMNVPTGQAVPQASPLQGLAQHPLVQALIKGIANAAQSYGWTAMQPQERLERTQLQQQKAETLAKLAETGAYQGANIDVRNRAQDTNAAKQVTNEGKLDLAGKTFDLKEAKQTFDQGMAQSKLSLAQDANEWKKDIAQGRLSQGADRILNQAQQFQEKLDQMRDLQTRGLDIRQYQADIQAQMVPIRQGLLELGQTALSQRGTIEGAQAQSKIQQFTIEHPIMSSILGLDDINKLAGQAGQAPIPGVAPTQGPPAGGAPPSAAPPNVGAPTNAKAQAKANQKKPAGGGVTHQFVPGQGIVPVGGGGAQ